MLLVIPDQRHPSRLTAARKCQCPSAQRDRHPVLLIGPAVPDSRASIVDHADRLHRPLADRVGAALRVIRVVAAYLRRRPTLGRRGDRDVSLATGTIDDDVEREQVDTVAPVFGDHGVDPLRGYSTVAIPAVAARFVARSRMRYS